MSKEYIKATNALRASVHSPPLDFLTRDHPKGKPARPAQNVGDGPALDQDHAELAALIRSDWRSRVESIRVAVNEFVSVTGDMELADSYRDFELVLVKLDSAVRYHDQEKRLEAAWYPHDHPPRTGGSLVSHPDVVRRAERAWLYKSRGVDVMGTTFVYFQGAPTWSVWVAWHDLVKSVDALLRADVSVTTRSGDQRKKGRHKGDPKTRIQTAVFTLHKKGANPSRAEVARTMGVDRSMLSQVPYKEFYQEAVETIRRAGRGSISTLDGDSAYDDE